MRPLGKHPGWNRHHLAMLMFIVALAVAVISLDASTTCGRASSGAGFAMCSPLEMADWIGDGASVYFWLRAALDLTPFVLLAASVIAMARE